jgi:hypothetical protein
MKSLVLSQPMFLPWRGMFEQIKLCDVFVFYDTVQLPLGGGKGRGFITRVQIKTPRGQEWLSLPVARGGHGVQSICEAKLDGTAWKKRHLNLIRDSYKTAPFFSVVFESLVEPLYNFETENLSEFCICSMMLLNSALGLQKPIFLASQLNVAAPENASARVLEYCKFFNASVYITGHGAANYMDFALFESAGVDVRFMDYKLTPYPQLHGTFTPYVSVLDLLFNVGLDAAPGYLNSNLIGWEEFV